MTGIDTKSIHQITVNDVNGKPVKLEQYKGKVCLIINTASKCGFTPQLSDMTELYREFRAEGFEILAFPSNDFAGQEPLDGAEIEQFCTLNYEAEYPIFEKTHVKGGKASELFQFLSNKEQNGKLSSAPRWNFHKYLIDRNGQLVDFFYTITSPTASRVKRAIRKLL
ncbi:MAG: glutathione peroxidase [Bacteroidota bacterium]